MESSGQRCHLDVSLKTFARGVICLLPATFVAQVLVDLPMPLFLCLRQRGAWDGHNVAFGGLKK